jgi:FdhD protein
MMNDTAPVVEEVKVRLIADDTKLFEWQCSPDDLEALAIGRLYIERMVSDASLLNQLDVRRRAHEYEIHLPASLNVSKQPRVRIPRVEIPQVDAFAELFRDLFSAVDAHHESGGMHAAALAANGTLAFEAEDVGRHNAVDKVIGMAVIAGADIANHGMLVSSRVSGEIARKAGSCVVAWLASRSIPTTLAVNTARMLSMPIIGRAAGKNAHIYQ